jgi:hypothetical protein
MIMAYFKTLSWHIRGSLLENTDYTEAGQTDPNRDPKWAPPKHESETLPLLEELTFR